MKTITPQNEMNDAIAAIDKAARYDLACEKAAGVMSQARIDLVMGKDAAAVYFASIAYRLDNQPSPDLDTAATNGKKVIYNPEFVADLNRGKALFLTAHEVLHVANAHHARMGNRDEKRWNMACDLAINPLLAEIVGRHAKATDRRVKMEMIDGALMPGVEPFADLPLGLRAEEYYSLLPTDQQDDEPAGSDPGGCGGVQKPGDGSEAAARQAEAEAKEMAAAAQAAADSSGRGDLPAGIGRAIKNLLNPKVDPREVLREFVTRQARNDYSWARQNRRFIHRGLYLPGMHSEELGKVVLACDESGSVSDEQMRIFGGWMNEILEAFPTAELVILHHDTKVGFVEEWKATDGPLVLERKCMGGTSHVDVFDVIERDHGDADCVVCLTDLDTSFPTRSPQAPVLWMTVGNSAKTPPFGRTAKMD